MYYDRNGQPMGLMEWARAFNDTAARRVAETRLPDGKWVSTVWLGLDHGHGEDPPIIFETMVFDGARPGRSADLDCERYATEDEARTGHERMVQKWSARQ